MTIRINSWSGPRNISTALMYSFAQRGDTTVVDEPLYGYSLRHLGTDHPGRAEVLAVQDDDGERVVRDVMLGHYDTPVVFFKQMARHVIGLDPAFLAKTQNMLLIRDPAPVIASLHANLESPSALDVSLGVQHDLYRTLIDLGQKPPIVDSRDVLTDPEGMLRAICGHFGMDFDPAMLAWEAGPRPEDGVWAEHWYANVHASTGFMPYRPREVTLPDHLAPVLEECLPHYEFLWERRISP